tara:strand:- start:138718 stop:139107 length:390 start_codon:yes stop_codon:yes gene_type:complete
MYVQRRYTTNPHESPDPEKGYSGKRPDRSILAKHNKHSKTYSRYVRWSFAFQWWDKDASSLSAHFTLGPCHRDAISSRVFDQTDEADAQLNDANREGDYLSRNRLAAAFIPTCALKLCAARWGRFFALQ